MIMVSYFKVYFCIYICLMNFDEKQKINNQIMNDLAIYIVL